MKKMLSACAIVLVCLSYTSCTKQPLLENTNEQLTTGENSSEDDKP